MTLYHRIGKCKIFFIFCNLFVIFESRPLLLLYSFQNSFYGLFQIQSVLADRKVRILFKKLHSLLIKFQKSLAFPQYHAATFRMMKPVTYCLERSLQIYDCPDFLIMVHRIFTVHHAPAGGYDRMVRLQFRVDPVLYFQESGNALFPDDFFQKFSLFFLDQDIHIYKMIAQPLCRHHSHRAFPHSRHTDKYKIFHGTSSFRFPYFNTSESDCHGKNESPAPLEKSPAPAPVFGPSP